MDPVQAGWEHFPCSNCGATLHYKPGEDQLVCGYCSTTNVIEGIDQSIAELDFVQTIEGLKSDSFAATSNIIRCSECGASFELGEDMHSGSCSYCHSPVVSETVSQRQLLPQGLISFQVDKRSARVKFKAWIQGLWFAPNALKRTLKDSQGLDGIYVPYWTFDSSTNTDYVGQRGTYYQERQRVPVMVNGKQKMQTIMVTKVRWHAVKGRVSRRFDDVLVAATTSLPKSVMRKLKSWRLSALRPYQAAYLSGFQSQMYQQTPEQGLVEAKQIMEVTIRNDIVRDIGGDLQRITHMRSQHAEIQFKHILLPIWISSYRFGKRVYRFVVNGQTGEVNGERPFSWVKIGCLIVFCLLIIALFFVYSEYQA